MGFFYTLVVVFTGVYTFITTHGTIYLKCVYFIAYKLYHKKSFSKQYKRPLDLQITSEHINIFITFIIINKSPKTVFRIQIYCSLNFAYFSSQNKRESSRDLWYILRINFYILANNSVRSLDFTTPQINILFPCNN